MKTIFKTIQVPATAAMKVYVDEKIIQPIQQIFGRTDTAAFRMDIEVGRVTRHHRKGQVWHARVVLEAIGSSLYAETNGESFEEVVDLLNQEITQEVRKLKGKRKAQELRGARRAKQKATITKAARFYRKGRIREEGR